MATTQTVTVLFTDLVGSTAQDSAIGPEAANDLRQEHFALLRAAIDASGGSEVKKLGDGLMVVFTSLSRALACGVAIQQGIERRNRRGTAHPLSVRIGLSAGETTEDDGDFYGEPVVESARLCALADGGQILATEAVKVLAGRHATQEFVSVGHLELKGLPERVPCVEVRWEPALTQEDTGGQFPLPARLVGASSASLFAFFGRTSEMARLAEVQKWTASDSHLRAIFVSGEPGIGKTTLVAQAARAVHAGGGNVVYGTCEEGLGVAYGPWIGILDQLVDQLEEAILRDFVEKNGLALARVVPSMARRLSLETPSAGSDPDTERFLLLEGATRLLSEASSNRPLMVVVDDLHWADAASLQLLRHLVTSPNRMAVFVVGTFREGDLSRGHPLTSALAALRKEPAVGRLELSGLEGTEIMEMMEAAAGHALPDEGVGLAHALRRETAGNPFFVVEVIRHLAEAGAFTQDAEGHWVLTTDLDAISLPSSVREVVAHRVARLGEETERALSLAAVIGREFDLALLAELADRPEDELIDLLESAIDAGLVGEDPEEAGRYRFVHAIVQHTLYQDLGATRRQRAHERVAEALEGTAANSDEAVVELARHWLSATRPDDVTKALHYARRAGELALATYAPLDAVGWFTQALDLLERHAPDDERGRAELLVGLGTAQRQAGRPEHALALRDAGRIARRLNDTELLVAVALSREPGMQSMSEPNPERMAVVEAALDAVGPSDSARRARLLACLAEEIDPRDVNRRCDVAIRALDMAHRLDDAPTLVDVVSLTMTPLTTPDTLPRRLAETEKALALSESLADVSVRLSTLLSRSVACACAGDLATHTICLEEMSEIAAGTGLPIAGYMVNYCSSWRSLLAGDVEEAQRHAEKAFEYGSAANVPVAFVGYGAQRWRIDLERGRLADSIDLFAQMASENPAMPVVGIALMTAYSESGRGDEAGALLDAGCASRFADIPFDILWLPGMAAYAEVAADWGRRDAAALLYELLQPYEAQFICIAVLDYGTTSRILGRLAALLERYDVAQSHLETALEMHERLKAPYWIARTHLDMAELCLYRQGESDRETATELLAKVRASADRHGYGGLQPRIERLAGRL